MKPKGAKEIFRLVAPEFGKVDGKTVGAWLALTEPLVSRRAFGGLHGQALAFLAAHRMKVAGVGCGDESLKPETDKIGAMKRAGVASFSEGSVSLSLNHSAAEAELSSTEYGREYLSLRRKRIAPIVSAAEPS